MNEKLRLFVTGPVTPLEELVSDNYVASLPSGSTPTIFDVDDYKSLLRESVDTLLPIPKPILQDIDKLNPSQCEHEYVHYMYNEYAASATNGLVPIPKEDLPESISSSSAKPTSVGKNYSSSK